MFRKSTYRFIVLLLVLCMVFPTTAFAEAAEKTISDTQGYSETDAIIDALTDERASILNKIFAYSDEKVPNSLIHELNEIDLSLMAHGVTFLSDEEVRAQFPDTKTNKALSLSGQTSHTTTDSTDQTRASAPDSSVNTWTSARSNYTKDGITYNIQRLTAQPASASSPLANAGAKVLTFTNNWKAGAVNAVKSVAKALLGEVVKNISGASVALTFYDAVSAFVSGISSTTEVDVPNISYSWASTTTAVFTYVRLSSQSDSHQWLSLVSTKATTEVGYTIARFNYKNANGSTVLSPKLDQGTRTISSRPTNYNSTALAVEQYNSVSVDPLRNVVSYIKISGPEDKQVVKISPCAPFDLWHCEY